MEEHIQKLHRLYQQFNARGQMVSDKDFTNTLLTSLPDTWFTFITTVNATSGTISSEMLIAQILDEDRICHSGSTKQTMLQAKGQKPEQLGATKGNCRNYRKKGNYVVDCWEKGGRKEGQVPKWWKPKTESTDKDSAKQIEDADFAFLADDRALSSMSASDWLVNSVTTTHIVWE